MRETVSIILQVCLISSFIAIFFFTYVAKVEEEVVKTKVNYLVDSFTGDQKIFFKDPLIRSTFTKGIDKLEAPDMSKEDQLVQENNDKLFATAIDVVINMLSIAVIVYLLYFLSLSGKDSKNALKVLVISLTTVVAVAITELGFLHIVVANYKALDPNYFRAKILKNLKNFSRS
jgi:hypothetical protein